MKSELIKVDYEKLNGGAQEGRTISFETTRSTRTIPNNHIIIASRHNSQQPMVIPKLPIQFADFPNHLYSVSWESFKLRHLMRNSVRIAWKCKEEPGLSFRAIRFSWNPPSIGNKLKGSFFPRFRVFLIIIITPHASTVTPLDADRGDLEKPHLSLKAKENCSPIKDNCCE